jgi:hypothetical protein
MGGEWCGISITNEYVIEVNILPLSLSNLRRLRGEVLCLSVSAECVPLPGLDLADEVFRNRPLLGSHA